MKRQLLGPSATQVPALRRARPSRRALVKGGLAGALLAPILRARRAEADQRFPTRLVLLYTPNSHPQDFWPDPGAAPESFVLRPAMSALEPLARKLLFARPLHHTFTSGNHHEAGIVQCFTGQPHAADPRRFALGPSLDQVAADRLQGAAFRRSLHLAVDDGRPDKRHIICYRDREQPIFNQIDPRQAFADLFASPLVARDPLARRIDRAVLSVSAAELESFTPYLGRQEQQKLELHAQALRQIERQLEALAPGEAGVACGPSAPTGTYDLRSTQNIESWIKVQADILIAALACDRSRVASLQLHHSGAHLPRVLPEHLALSGGMSWHDDVAHRASERRPLYNQLLAYHARWVAYVARALDALPEGDGTVLDRTILLWGTDVGTDHNHGPADIPYLVVGGGALGLRTGRYLRFPQSQEAQKLHTAVLHALGIRTAGFGERPSCGPLPGANV